MSSLFFFLLAITVLVAAHEYGHYRMAVACGVRVERFSIGFGPVIWRWRPRRPRPGQDTEFVISALPLGGYVRMLDETVESVPEPLRAQAFNRQSLGRRALIVAAGPVANLLLAWVLLAGLGWWGQMQWKAVVSAPVAGSLLDRAGLHSGDEVHAVVVDGEHSDVQSFEELRWHLARAGAQDLSMTLQVRSTTGRERELALDWSQMKSELSEPEGWRELGLQGPWSAPVLARLIPGGQAEREGLLAGDRILQIGTVSVRDATQLRQLVRDSLDAQSQPMAQVWRFERAGSVQELEIEPRLHEQTGRAVGRIDALVGGEPAQVWVSHDAITAVARAASRLAEMTQTMLGVMGRMLVGEAPLSHLSGPISMAEQAGESAQQGSSAYLMYLIWVSLSLGVLNLLPIPMLDGGHLLCYLYEMIARRPMSARAMAVWQRLGLVLILMLMALALLNDLLRWWSAG
ncbi:MAG: RIP metalloprotease RseP [Alphaproteobacteria bacterium]|nr:RIP metalloprotease RseP [Alphaproteobacteria bacterium]